jgi:hypothetical protein
VCHRALPSAAGPLTSQLFLPALVFYLLLILSLSLPLFFSLFISLSISSSLFVSPSLSLSLVLSLFSPFLYFSFSLTTLPTSKLPLRGGMVGERDARDSALIRPHIQALHHIDRKLLGPPPVLFADAR